MNYERYLTLPESEIAEYHGKFCYQRVIYDNVTSDTIKWYTSSMKTFCGFLSDNFYELEIRSLNIDVISKYFDYGVNNRAWKQNTLANYYKAIKSFVDWLFKNDYIDLNPFDNIPRPREEVGLPKYLTVIESKKLLNWLANAKWSYTFERYRNLAVFATFLFTGLRLSELLNLKVDNIDFVSDIIRVNKGKGGKDRILPLNERLKKILLDYSKERQRLMRKTNYFITSTNRDKGFTSSGLNKVIKRINEEAGIGKKIHAHMLRHTAATLVLSGSGDLRAVQAMLGHSNISMTLRYAACTSDHLSKQMSKNPLEL
jgi:site-specific recombinase XerD